MTIEQLIESLIRMNRNEDTDREALAYQGWDRFEVWVDSQGNLQIAKNAEENE